MDQVKADILSYMAETGADVGHVLAEKPFYFQRARHYTPPQQDAIGPALDSLVADGTLEKRDSSYFLTESGFNRLYPSNMSDVIEFVKSDILDFLRSNSARVGHALAQRPFAFQRVMHYNPQQQKAVDQALISLVADGTLEQRQNGYFLTQSGYDALY